MNYREQLMQEHSRVNTDVIAKAIGNDSKELSKLIDILYNESPPLPQRVSWVLAVVNKNRPSLLYPYISKFIDTIADFKINGIRRNLLSILSKQPIAEKDAGYITNYCFQLLLKPEEPVAVKVHAMQIIANIANEYPELIDELKAVLTDQESKNSIAFSARAKHILKALNIKKQKVNTFLN